MSRRHAEIVVTEDKSTHIQDAGSLNGVYINRVKVLGARLQSGDLVQFGGAAGLEEGAQLGPASNKAIVYRYLERPASAGGVPRAEEGEKVGNRRRASGGGGGGGGGGSSSGGGGNKRQRTSTDNKTGGGGGKTIAGSSRPSSSSSKPSASQTTTVAPDDVQGREKEHAEMRAEIASLREALATARQEEGWVFRALGMKPSAGLKQVAEAVRTAQADATSAREAEGKHLLAMEAAVRQTHATQEAMKAKDALLMMAEARSEAALGEIQALQKEVALAARAQAEREKEYEAELAGVTRSRNLLQAQLDKFKAVRTRGKSPSRGANTSNGTLLALQSEMGCALCSNLMMDASVLPCSHAFCFQCVHAHLGSASKAEAEAAEEGEGETRPCCPVCRDVLPPAARPYRSSNLDVVVALVVEAMEEGGVEHSDWVDRERRLKQFYQKHGGEKAMCYPHALPSPEEEEEARREAKARKEQARREREGGLAMAVVDDGVISPTQSSSRPALQQQQPAAAAQLSTKKLDPLMSLVAEEMAKVAAASAKKKGRVGNHVCEGCNEKGHFFADCPHRSLDSNEEEEEEEEEVEEDDEEEDGGW